MPKFIIKWNAGYGESSQIVEANSHHEALNDAYLSWKEESESAADYSAEQYSKQGAIDLGLEDEE